MKRDHGKVDTIWLVESDSAGVGGPSIPDPVVQPRPVAALSTNPIAASYSPKRKIVLHFSNLRRQNCRISGILPTLLDRQAGMISLTI